MSREDDSVCQRGAWSILAHAGCVRDQSVCASFRNDAVRILCRTFCIQQSIFKLVSVQSAPFVNLPGAVEADLPMSRDDHPFGPVCSVGQVPREGRSRATRAQAHDVFDSCDRFAVAWGEVSPSPQTAGRYSVTPKTRSPLALLSTQSSQKLTSRQQARQSCAWARVARERPSRGTWPTEQTGPKGWSSRLIGKSASTAPGRFTNGAD